MERRRAKVRPPCLVTCRVLPQSLTSALPARAGQRRFSDISRAAALSRGQCGHAACAQLPLDTVAVGLGGGQAVARLAHGAVPAFRSSSSSQPSTRSIRRGASSGGCLIIKNRRPSAVTS